MSSLLLKIRVSKNILKFWGSLKMLCASQPETSEVLTRCNSVSYAYCFEQTSSKLR